MGIIRFIISENTTNGQIAFSKSSFRKLELTLVASASTIISLYFQAQGELYTHDSISFTVPTPYKTVVIDKIIEDLNKGNITTIRDSSGHSIDKGVYKHISSMGYNAST